MIEDPKITNSLKRSEFELVSIEDKLANLENFLGQISDIKFDVKKQLYEEAFESIKQKIIDMLIKNYEASGIETRTGTLLENIKRARLAIYFKSERSDPEIAVKMPREQDAKKYKDEDVKKTYTVANSLNFGSVRAPHETQEITHTNTGRSRVAKASVLNEGQKRKVKKQILGFEVKNNSMLGKKKKAKTKGVDFIGGVSLDFSTARRGKNSTKIGISYLVKDEEKKGEVIVIDPKPYFYLSSGQLSEIGMLLRERVQKQLDQMSL